MMIMATYNKEQTGETDVPPDWLIREYMDLIY